MIVKEQKEPSSKVDLIHKCAMKLNCCKKQSVKLFTTEMSILGVDEGNAKHKNQHKYLPISSMKITEGCSLIARENTAAASFWDSPYHLSVRVEGCRLMKRNPASLAVALAIRVFPQPGGPYSNTPEKMTSKPP